MISIIGEIIEIIRNLIISLEEDFHPIFRKLFVIRPLESRDGASQQVSREFHARIEDYEVCTYPL